MASAVAASAALVVSAVPPINNLQQRLVPPTQIPSRRGRFTTRATRVEWDGSVSSAADPSDVKTPAHSSIWTTLTAQPIRSVLEPPMLPMSTEKRKATGSAGISGSTTDFVQNALALMAQE
ncbi:MAG TPA: hypothetical protein VM260_20280, partial [Pirellula sp.]|nr:hypothetical protein [Pirellula sp.]